MYSGILSYFSGLKQFQRISSSYIFIGEELLPLAVSVAKLVNCGQDSCYCETCASCQEIARNSSFDFLIVDEPRTIKIDHIRSCRQFLSVKNMSLDKKVLIINNFHDCGPEAANSFLKILEEPPGNSLIILLTSRLDMVLPTVSSRCKKLYCPSAEGGYAFKDFENTAGLLAGGGGAVFKTREEAGNTLADSIAFLRDRLVYGLTGDKNLLLNPVGYEIIPSLEGVCGPRIIEKIIKIYNESDSINLNLAANVFNRLLDR